MGIELNSSRAAESTKLNERSKAICGFFIEIALEGRGRVGKISEEFGKNTVSLFALLLLQDNEGILMN